MTKLCPAPLHYLHLRSGLYRRACACAWCLFHVLAFDSCWIHIKPTSKRGDSPFIGAVGERQPANADVFPVYRA